MPSDEVEMIRAIGLQSVDDLFADIPAAVRIPRALRHHRRAVLANYLVGTGVKVREVDYDRATGMLDLGKLHEALGSDVCGVYVENPNFFGRFEEQLQEIRDATKAIFVVGV